MKFLPIIAVLLLLSAPAFAELQTSGQSTSSNRVSNEDIATNLRVLDNTIKSNQKNIEGMMASEFEKYDEQRDLDMLKLGLMNTFGVLFALLVYRWLSQTHVRRMHETLDLALRQHGIDPQPKPRNEPKMIPMQPPPQPDKST